MIDVGANVGEWTTALREAVPTATVYAFKPSPAAFARLEERFRDDPKVITENLAMGSEVETVRLWSDAPGSGHASLYERDLGQVGSALNRSEEVEVTTLDRWCSEHRVLADVIKIDVEGHELAVLRGAERALANVRAVQFEFGGTAIDAGTYWKDFWYLFVERGFRLHRIAPSGLVPIPNYYERDEVFTYQNFIAVRPRA